MLPLLCAEQLCAVCCEGDGLNLTLTAGDRVGILGTVGSGKTALLRTLAHLQSPAGGRLRWGEIDVTHKARWLLGKRRTFVVLLSANPYTSFAPWATVRQFFSAAQRVSLVERLQQGGMPPVAADDAVRALSGAERVRFALLHVLQNDPGVLLVDDVFQWVVPELWQPLVDELNAGTGKTRALVVASRFWQALRTMEHIIVLSKGAVVEWGPRETVFAQPQHPYTRRLLEQGIAGDYGRPTLGDEDRERE